MNRHHSSATLRVTTSVFRSHNDRLAAHLSSAPRTAAPSPLDIVDEYLAGAPEPVRRAWRLVRTTVSR